MSEFKICNKCCEYTNSFVDGLGECIKCMKVEPKERKAKRYKKIDREIFQEKFSDHRARVKENIERNREKRRKQRLSKVFF